MTGRTKHPLSSGLAPCVLCIAVALGVVTLPAQSDLPRVAPGSIGLARAPLVEATALLNQLVEERKIAGAVGLVARRGQIGYLEAVGLQDLDAGRPMRSDTLFRIYSMSKAVTAVAVMMLHDEGRFALTDPVSKYLPEFGSVMLLDHQDAAPRKPTRAMTIEDLLLHTSGLSHRTSELYTRLQVRSRADTLPQFIGKIVAAPLMEDPHTRFRYSEGTTVLGRLVEVWSGQTFDVFLDERIFRPLGMKDTGFWVGAEKSGRLATVYTPRDSGGLDAIEIEAVPFTVRPPLLEGAVGLVSSAPDFFRFCQMLLNRGELNGRRLLRASTVERMTINSLPPDIRSARGGAMGWGLANVNVLDRPELAASGHLGEYGWDGTAGTIFWIDPSTETITILMTQSVPANPDRIRQRFKSIVQRAVVD